jgi:hypothetical protein
VGEPNAPSLPGFKKEGNFRIMTLIENAQNEARHLLIKLRSQDAPTAVETLAQALIDVRHEALDEAIHAVTCTPKFPTSDHDAHARVANAIRKLKE